MRKTSAIGLHLLLIASQIFCTTIPTIDLESYTRNCDLIVIGKLQRICLWKGSSFSSHRVTIEGSAEIAVDEVIHGVISDKKIVRLKIDHEVSEYGVDYRKLENQQRIWLLVRDNRTAVYFADHPSVILSPLDKAKIVKILKTPPGPQEEDIKE